MSDVRRRRPMTTIGSRKVHRPRKVKVASGSDGESDYDEQDVYLTEQNNGFYPVKGQPGMFYKVRKIKSNFDIYVYCFLFFLFFLHQRT